MAAVDAPTRAPLVRIDGVRKEFGAIVALEQVDLDVGAGEIVAVVGDNGAGKSTLIKLIAGVHQPTRGRLLLDGEPVRLGNPNDSRRHGIEVVYQDLALADNQPEIIDPKISVFFRDVDDHLTRVHEMVTGYDELLTSMLQASLAQLSVAQNEDMRRITSWAAIIAVPTAVTGIYGMNFDHMPELHWTFGYPLVLGLIATACVLLYRGFRRNGWL